MFSSILDVFRISRDYSCTAGNLENSQIEGVPLSKKDLGKKVRDYYYGCLRRLYRYGYADLDGQGNSEAQSYGLLQAYFMDDKLTFRNIWNWTQYNLQREDGLFSWDYDLRHNFFTFPGKKALIKDQNSATDADEDIAMALLLAGEDWGNQEYIDEGRKIVKSIWEKEVSLHNGKHYLLPGPWGADERQIIINPSYFSPAAYRIFSKYDPDHDWQKLARDSYSILQDIRNGANRGQFNEFPPNWVVLEKDTGRMRQFDGKPDSFDYSYDAFRVLWRAAYDQLTSPNFESWNYVSSFQGIIERDWNDDQRLCTLYYYRNGTLQCDTAPTGLAGELGIMSVTNGYIAERIVKKYYLEGNKLILPEDSFYGKSWHWFGAYLFSKS